MHYSVIVTTPHTQLPFDHISQHTLALFTEHKPHSLRESLMGRLLVTTLLHIPSEHVDRFLKKSLQGYYDNENNSYWSISHKHGRIAAAVDGRPLGIDIEKIQPKDPLLFNIFDQKEWEILEQKKWPQFYRGWTAKEATLKTLSLGLDQHANVHIVKNSDNMLLLAYEKQHITANIFKEDDFIIAVAQITV